MHLLGTTAGALQTGARAGVKATRLCLRARQRSVPAPARRSGADQLLLLSPIERQIDPVGEPRCCEIDRLSAAQDFIDDFGRPRKIVSTISGARKASGSSRLM